MISLIINQLHSYPLLIALPVIIIASPLVAYTLVLIMAGIPIESTSQHPSN